MVRVHHAVMGFALALSLPVAALAQAPGKSPAPRPKAETQAELQRQAKVSLADATGVALKTVPGATVVSHELEREHGKLIYSFDMKLAGRSGIEEVAVDAMTGAMIAKVHETPAQEAAEARKDSAKKPPVRKP